MREEGEAEAKVSKVTITASDTAELGEGWRRVALDCPHGTTTAHYANGRAGHLQLAEVDVVRALLMKHHAEQQCRCTRSLRRRYGLTRTW